jgi:hypothetical protein
VEKDARKWRISKQEEYCEEVCFEKENNKKEDEKND